ncbi:hypothetical protein TKK_0012861 [Trichogramma kaykai]
MFSIIQRLLLQPISTDLIRASIVTSACNYKNVPKRHLDFSKVPKLVEAELDFQYVRGSGPGGQATNKTSNCVVLKHIPTGIVVKCHDTRSALQNKELAKIKLIDKLDLLYNGEDAIENQKKKFLLKKTLEKKRRQRKRAEEKAEAKRIATLMTQSSESDSKVE